MKPLCAAALLFLTGCSTIQRDVSAWSTEQTAWIGEATSVAALAQDYRRARGDWPGSMSGLDTLRLSELRVTSFAPQIDETLRIGFVRVAGSSGVLNVYPSDSTAIEFSSPGITMNGTIRMSAPVPS